MESVEFIKLFVTCRSCLQVVEQQTVRNNN